MEIDYEKKYNEALERAKRLRDSFYQTMNAKRVVEEIFPQLAESEDERIRKAIVHLLTVASESYLIDATGFKKEQFLSWLEKQKEQKVDIDKLRRDIYQSGYNDGYQHGKEDAQKEQKPLITGNDFGWINELKHDLKHPEELDEKVQEVLKKRQKPVEPSDDELQRHQDELHDFKVFAAKQAKEHHISFVHDFEWNNFCAELLSYFHEQKPEKWSEFDKGLLERAISIIGWAGSCTDKYKIINPDGAAELQKFLKSLRPQPKQEWNEEDERYLIWLCRIIHSRVVNKELSLAEESKLGKWIDKWINHEPQPVQKWDEFDEDCLKRAIWYIENPAPSVVKDTNLVLWLKSLRPRPSWKPSEEQMSALNYAIAEWDGGKKLEGLYDLRTDLKKLM